MQMTAEIGWGPKTFILRGPQVDQQRRCPAIHWELFHRPLYSYVMVYTIEFLIDKVNIMVQSNVN